MNEQIQTIGDVALDCSIRQLDVALQDAACESAKRLLRRVGMVDIDSLEKNIQTLLSEK